MIIYYEAVAVDLAGRIGCGHEHRSARGAARCLAGLREPGGPSPSVFKYELGRWPRRLGYRAVVVE